MEDNQQYQTLFRQVHFFVRSRLAHWLCRSMRKDKNVYIHERLFSGSGVLIEVHATSAPMSVARRAFPRRRALWTTSKKARQAGSFSCETPRCGRSQERSEDHRPSIVLTCTSQKPSPSSSRAHSPRAWHTVSWP